MTLHRGLVFVVAMTAVLAGADALGQVTRADYDRALGLREKYEARLDVWLKEIMADLGPDRQVAWKVLSVVLRKLRDRLPLGLAAHLGA